MLRSSKDKKKRKCRSRVIKDEEEIASIDPDYSPHEELMDEGSGEISSCSTPLEEKSQHSPSAIVHPNSGTICALCYCGEKSLLGQGDLTRYDPTSGFNPFRKPVQKRGNRDMLSGVSPGPDADRSSKSPSRSRNRETRLSRDSTSRHGDSNPPSVVPELSVLGCQDIADPSNVFESTGHVTAHHCCAAWSEGVTQNEHYQLLLVDKAVHQGLSSKCSYCSRYGATIKCKAPRCDKLYHYPCAAGSGCFQDIKSMLMLCPSHLDQAPSIGAPEELNCAVCDDVGEISDFLFCTSCGHHYHGNCLHPDVNVNPVVRAGWQCPDCKICQTCRQPGDDNKMLVCDSCDKGYHTYCLEPAISYIPSNGWCCQNCRYCADCGVKRGAGPPCLWNHSEEVCDICYQQQNKGHCCPVCGKGYSEKIQHGDMVKCKSCKKRVHEDCDDTVDLDESIPTDYTCPKCRNEETQMETEASPAELPPTVEVKSSEPKDVRVEKQPAKRSSVSSSLDSNTSSTAMKGSSTDPMLFTQTSSNSNIDDKQRHISDETIAIVAQQVRTVVERKASGDTQLGTLFADAEDPLSLFNNDAFQPIVMLQGGDENALLKTGEECEKQKPRKLSGERSGAKSGSAVTPSRPGMGKPGSVYGKGKPFGNKRKAPSKSSKGKSASKDKSSKASRRPRQGSTYSNPSNAPSPGGCSASSPAVVTSSMSMRRRPRARCTRQDSSLVGGLPADPSHDQGDEEFGDSMHNTVVLCSADDTFTLNQDMCVVCGSFGLGTEGRLVSCSQCGQCYHPYCVNLKLTKVVLRKGWRCLDCTVCEECGAADDPSHLLLCDDCDVSYHTYCLKPPLLHVPKGGWKCKWCVRCTHCGTSSPGFNCDWAENYTSCGPCASLTHCPICRRSYRDDETIMQCSSCERWVHSSCEYLTSESDIEKVLEKGYSCIFCRPKGSIPPHLDLNPPNAFEGDPASGIYLGRTRSDVEQVKEYRKDGVALTSAGLQHIQQLMQSAMGLNKKKPNVQKRKTQVQKQADKVTSPLDTKTDADAGTTTTATEPAGKDAVKDDESLVGMDVSQNSQMSTGTAEMATENSSSLDIDNDESLDKETLLDQLSVASTEPADENSSASAGQSSQVETPDSLPLPAEVAEGPETPTAPADANKLPVAGVQDGGIKRRRKPYRPGIGGFMVRQRNRGGFMSPKVRKSRIFKAVPSLASGNFSSTTGFDSSPSKVDDVKLRASEITGEFGSSYIKHENEGGITIAHQESAELETKPDSNAEAKTESAGQTSILVSPLKLKISTLPQPQQPQKPKRKKRTRLIDQFPLYIQEGFFGNDVLHIARSTTADKLDLAEETDTSKRTQARNDSQIVLPERVKLRLDTQVAMKAAEAKRKAEMKEKLQSRQPPGDDVGLMTDKESEDLLGVLPDDLPFKEDDILGMLSQGHGGGSDAHESILSPSALESLVTDGLASIDGDMTSLFSDVLNQGQDGTGDDNLLGDIGNLTDPPKSSSAADVMTSSMQDNHGTSSAALDAETTDAIISQITGEHNRDMIAGNAPIKDEPAMMQPKPTMTSQMPGQMQQQQQLQVHPQQLNIQPMQSRVQQGNFEMQNQMQTNIMNKHMFGDMPASDGGMLVPQQQQQHPHFAGPIQQMPMQIEQSANQCPPMQPQQKFLSRHEQSGIMQNITGNVAMQSPAHEHIHPHAILSRQHSIDGGQEIQAPQTKVMAPTGAMIQMYGAQHAQGVQKQAPQPSTPMGSAPISHTAGLMSKLDPASGQIDQAGQAANLPDLTRDSNIFEPAPLPWPLGTDLEGDTLTVNQRNILKWEKDEPLGKLATISPVLYANMKHPHLKKDFPDWQSRAKQVAKLWRKATPEERAPFLQKARDNRAYLKSSRRDPVDPHDPEDQEEDEKVIMAQLHGVGFGISSENRPGPIPVDGSRLPQATLQQQGMHQGLMRVPSTSPIAAPEFGNFVKPKPLSRDPTPKPLSPGVAPSIGARSKSPSAAFPMPPQQINPMASPQRPRSHWGDAGAPPGQGASQQHQMMQGPQNWQSQQQVCMMPQQPGARVPKVENMETTGMLSTQMMRFPQTFQPSHPQAPVLPAGHPGPMNNPPKPTLQRQGSSFEAPLHGNQEPLIMRPINPRPSVPPQLLPQALGPVQQMVQHPVPHSPVSPRPSSHGRRTASPKVPQPVTPQPAVRDLFQDMEKSMQRWPSTSSDQGLGQMPTEMQLNQQTAAVPQSPGPLRLPTPAEEGSVLPANEGTEKMLSTPRPQIREMLNRHTAQRRHKLLEQQVFPGSAWVAPGAAVITRPPPPYPSSSPMSTSQSQNAFVFGSEARPERFSGPQQPANLPINEPRMRNSRTPSLPPSPSFSTSFSGPLTPTHSFGVERFPSRTTSSSSVTGVHPISGQAPISGGYIELRHSKHTDPAIRREQLIRAGGALPVPTSDIKPVVSSASASTASSLSSCATTSVKVEPGAETFHTSAPTSTQPSKPAIQAKVTTIAAASTAVKTISIDVKTSSAQSTSGSQAPSSFPVSNVETVNSAVASDDKKSSDTSKPPTPARTTEKTVSETVASKGDEIGEKPEVESTTGKTAEVLQSTNELPSSEKVVEKSDDKPEAGVSSEHSYVKARDSDNSETTEAHDKALLTPSFVQRSISVSSDGQIHGVGLTPPPELSASMSAVPLEDGVLVSNIVVVDKDNKKVEEQPQKSESEKVTSLNQGVGNDKHLTRTVKTSDASEKVNSSVVAAPKVEDHAGENSRSESPKPVEKLDQHITKDEKQSESDASTSQKTSNIESATTTGKVDETPEVKSVLDQPESVQDQPQSVEVIKPFAAKAPAEGAREPSKPVEASRTIATATVNISDAKTASIGLFQAVSDATVSTSTISPIVSFQSVLVTSVAQAVMSQPITVVTTQAASVTSTAIPTQSTIMTSQITNSPSKTTAVTSGFGVIPSADEKQSEAASTSVAVNPVSIPQTTAISVQDNIRAAVRTTASIVPSQFSTSLTQSSVHHPSTHPLQPRPKPLLIKEQPLLLQELLEEEKQEQERAKLEKMNQEMVQPPAAMFSHAVVEDRLLQAKMKVLSGITQVIQGSTTQAGIEVVPPSGTTVQRPIGTWHQLPVNPHTIHPPADPSLLPPGASDADARQRKARYEEWLVQHHALLQMQGKALEQATKQHRTTKQALTKKQRQSKKSGEEFSQMDAQKLTLASKQHQDAQQQLDQVRREQARHSELMQTYKEKQQNIQPFMNPMAGAGQAAVVAQQQTGGEMVHMMQPSFQPSGIPPHQSMARQVSMPGITTQQQPGMVRKVPPNPVPPASAVAIGGGVVSASAAVPHVVASVTKPAQLAGVLPEAHRKMQENMGAHSQEVQPVRQINAPEMQQFVVQPSTVLNATSSVSQSVPIHGTADSSKIVAPTTSAQQMQPQPTQVMFPISVNVRAGLPGQLDSGQSQFMPAQVSSVNVNTGGNMATKGAMMRPIPPVSAPMFEMSSAGSMHHVIGMEGQITPAAMPPKEKPKRKRKKPKTSVTETSGLDPRLVMTQNMPAPENAAAALGNVVHHFTAASGPLLHAHVVSTLHGTVTSSTIVMATAPQVAPSATSHHREGLIFTAGQSVQPAVTPQPGSSVQSRMPSSTTPNQSFTLQHDTQPHGQGFLKSTSDLLVAGHPVPVDKIKKEISSPKAKVIKSGNSPIHAPPTPTRLSGLTEAEIDIIMATDPDARSTPATPDRTPAASPLTKSDEIRASEEEKTPPTRELTVDERSSLIDETISTVIREGYEYEEKIILAKETGEKVVPPQWMRPPKPTKFPPKPPAPLSPAKMMVQSHFGPGGFGQRVYGQPAYANNQELLRLMLKQGAEMPLGAASPMSGYGGLEKMEPGMVEQMKMHPESAYFYNASDGPPKKKRSRGSSKDKEGKEKVKKKKKKKHSVDEDDVFLHDSQRGPQSNIKHMHKGFPDVPGKQPVPWKPLPLLPLVEPEIKINFSMCMPKGTGLAQSKSLLEGTFGSATLGGMPDYYELLRCKDPFVYMHPPTPPSSLPPSPKRERLTSLDGEIVANQHVKIPDSLPTPPHQLSEMPDEFPSAKKSSDDIPPSSPEFDDGLQHFPSDLLRIMTYKSDTSIDQAASPILPVQSFPERDFDEADEISVTISFKNGNSKTVKKSLSQLSRVLSTSIVSFKMEDSKKDGKKEADLRHSDANKENKNFGSQSDPLNNGTLNRRRCLHCNEPVTGNGVRRPLSGENLQEEDVIFCNKDCYFKNEFSPKPKPEPSTKKKWKASQVYQRHTRKIDINSLISANPDPEYVSTRGRSVAFTPTGVVDGGDDKDGKGRGRGRRRGSTGPGEENKAAAKRWKGIKWKKWTVSIAAARSTSHKAPPDVDALLSKYGSALKPSPDTPDTRVCVLCGVRGDGDTKGVARLLNLDVDQWVHLNCALWSAEVYETQGGALINVDLAVSKGTSAYCVFCQKKGATIHCHRSRCTNIYHCACALECGCHFYKDKTVLCPSHTLSVAGQATPPHHDQLKTLAVFRKVYVQRKETKQIASIMQQGELTQGEKNYILRVGALMFHAVGQLSTHQMAQFHSKTAIYPVGYKATRIYWSSNNTRKRCKYICMITEKEGKPWFTTRYQAVASRPKTADKNLQGEWMEMTGECVKQEWSDLLQQLASLRSQQKMLKLFPAYINGENIFGLTSPVVCRILESLPNIELCANYKFRFGRSPILEVPLAINPTGCARSEPHIKHSRRKALKYYKIALLRLRLEQTSRERKGRPHTLISNLISEYYESTGVGDASTSLYGKHFVHSKSSQYRRMKQDWRNNVNLARSRIQGLGLFASRDIDPGTMVIEYIGETIRSEVAEKREKKYEAANRGVYMFRLDSDYIVDATVTGGPARYINHSCNPNCVAEVVNFEKEKKIMIISNRLILSGEELHYDYKFDFEDDGNKIPCLCGSVNCRKWMN